jgi:hypothetical protein
MKRRCPPFGGAPPVDERARDVVQSVQIMQIMQALWGG